MMSLFSSFDLLNFYGPLIFTTLLLWNLGNIFFKLSSFKSLFLVFSEYLSNFFNSLSNSNYSKNFNNLMLCNFIMMFLLNFFSIFPFIFPFTSQTSFVLLCSLIFWFPITMFSIFMKFKGQLSHFIPEGAPLGLAPLLFLIELVSSFIRPLTLMIRLVANILAGHLLLVLLCSFVMNFNSFFPFLLGLNMVEILVGLIQAYIFSTLLSLYYSEM